MTDSTHTTPKRLVPARKVVSTSRTRRVSRRIAGKTPLSLSAANSPTHSQGADAAGEKTALNIEDIASQLSSLSEQISKLTLDAAGASPPQSPPASAIPFPRYRARADSVSSSADSAKTLDSLFPRSVSREKEICSKLFAPLDAVPEPEELKERLLEELATPIPIHLHIYNMLKGEVDQRVLDKTFCIVEDTGNICPSLTPRVESALQVRNANVGTESMQQHVLDVFLMGIMATAQDHLPTDIKIDRNAKDDTMTIRRQRPDYLLHLNGQLVFKGEEKKEGDVRIIARELTDKMMPGSVGKGNKAKYLLCYATAGSRVLLECIHSENEMLECSEIIDLAKMRDRVAMVISLVNVMRIVRAH
ncbi:hypothetical protein GQ54DRAFT_302298 [Martensiomyces pterosporus]|nr:hypothetical protein GQ54DRAFT_302298 [Martensiomyces pterosporus]